MFIPLTKKKEGNIPKHIAVTTNGIFRYSQKSKCSLEESWQKSFNIILDLIRFQVDKNIPVLTFHLVPMGLVKKENFAEISEFISKFFNQLKKNTIINGNKVKISVIGKWYDLPNDLVESIKWVTRETKDYDSFFVNFCVNYDGGEEIVDAMRVIAMKVKNGSIDPSSINLEDVKEHLYSSYFIPPDLMVINAGLQSPKGFLLWDSVNSKIYFTDKLWPDFKKEDLAKIISKVC